MIIYPIPKSPHMNGTRIGPKEWQDWYVNLKLAVKVLRSVPEAKIAVITGFSLDEMYEADIYIETLREMGVSDPIVMREGFETTGQIEAAERLAREHGKKLLIVSTPLHLPRVMYYSSKNTSHRSSIFGVPRFSEIPRDISMIFLAPLIDLFGLRNIFVKRVSQRRIQGKL